MKIDEEAMYHYLKHMSPEELLDKHSNDLTASCAALLRDMTLPLLDNAEEIQIPEKAFKILQLMRKRESVWSKRSFQNWQSITLILLLSIISAFIGSRSQPQSGSDEDGANFNLRSETSTSQFDAQILESYEQLINEYEDRNVPLENNVVLAYESIVKVFLSRANEFLIQDNVVAKESYKKSLDWLDRLVQKLPMQSQDKYIKEYKEILEGLIMTSQELGQTRDADVYKTRLKKMNI